MTDAKLDEAIRLDRVRLLPGLPRGSDIVSVGTQTFDRVGRWSLSAGAYLYQVPDGPLLLCAQGNATHPWMFLPTRISWDIGVRVATDGTLQPLTKKERRLIPW